MDKLINEAYQKISGIYDDKGAGFIRHLIAAFLPVDKTLFNLLMEISETCCIVGLPSANIWILNDCPSKQIRYFLQITTSKSEKVRTEKAVLTM
jgi:hypothetical protein